MSFVKSKLKAARDALAKKDYGAACDAATQVLEHEPDNYNANVFLGLSSLELGQFEKSEQAYLRATTLNPDNPLAWQGISKFYEQREEWEKYANSLNHLTELYSNINETVKCAESWQKLVELRRERGTRLQLVEALSLLLPQSPIYVTLLSLPRPDLTNPASATTFTAQTAIHQSLPHLEEIVSLLEIHEEETIKKEVEKRRTRLGAAGPELVKKEVGREVWGTSKIPLLYNEILNHPNTSDELRRLTDAKLLRYKERYLYAIPDTASFGIEKSRVLMEVDELVEGVVILRIPDELAWTIFLEGKDHETIAGYDHRVVNQFIELFPSSPATSLLKGYFAYMNITISKQEDEDEAPAVVVGMEEDPFDTILNAYAANPNSMIANRVLAELYVSELDYENAIKVAERGLELLKRFEDSTGRKLSSVYLGYKVILATSLVHLFPPKHHPRALALIDEVLSQSPNHVAGLMGRAYVLQAASKWEEAAAFFARVVELLPDDLNEGLRAREENAWCRCQLQDLEVGIAILKDIVDTLKDQDGRDEDTARCLWRLGKCYWGMGESQREEAYRFFISSLKANASYAPAFTSLGIYYAESSSPLDPNRASKCFQKAFELDPREAEAARRLAEGFGEDREWDLVEVVARRTIEGEGGLHAGIEGTGASGASRYLPTNSWAWKAVGVVELHRRNYPPAIQAFQVALRAEPDDSVSWVRLGEAYSKAGRHVAAVKALERAHELNPHDWVCSYLIGDVKHQMGSFGDAISIFESILAHRQSEIGVLVSLGQAYLDLGRSESSEGFHLRAEQSYTTCISIGLRTIQASPGFRGVAWKTVGDAIYALSGRSTYGEEGVVREVLMAVVGLLPAESIHLSGLVPPPALLDEQPLTGLKVLEIAAAAYSYRISLDSSEMTPKSGSPWFDLGIALHSWVVKSTGDVNASKAQAEVVSCLTHALRENPGSDLYWAGLGDAFFLSNAKNAQHAYIKALEIDSKNAATWTKLGLLYLYHSDVELANESLYRAQTLDPDYAVAWIGQALVAIENGHDTEATAMFEHAVGLAPNVPEGDLEFASRSFNRYRFSRYDVKDSMENLLPAFFVLDRYCGRRPDDATGLHLFALVCEGLGHLDTAASLVTRTISILEAAYEVSEDPAVERQFTVANSNLARIRLALKDFEGAAQSFESALGLLPEDEEPETKLLRAQALFGLGLASFMQGNLEMALANLEAALESAGEDKALRGQVTVLLAQTMWAIQTDEFRESSKAQLLDCISADPENLTAINTLAGMGVLTDDESLVDAALSEILALPLEKRHELDPDRNVDYLLTQYHLGQGDVKKAVTVAQSAVWAEPSRSEARTALATLMLQQNQFDSALAVLSGSDDASIDNLPASLNIQAVAHSHSDRAVALREVQRAVMLSPSNMRCWQALALVRSQTGIGDESMACIMYAM
ncbi:TPR-like protein [Lyophyllum atratum]|nr:TPR-like protein [Lyophyllum atratum]